MFAVVVAIRSAIAVSVGIVDKTLVHVSSKVRLTVVVTS